MDLDDEEELMSAEFLKKRWQPSPKTRSIC
jgi:hypothetical protein